MHERPSIDSPTPRKSIFARLLRLPRLIPAWLRRTLAWLFWIGYFGFALIILALRYSVLPNIESYRPDIERGISQTAGLPVTIARIDTHWQGLRPHLSLRGFSIHDAAGRPGLTFTRSRPSCPGPRCGTGSCACTGWRSIRRRCTSAARRAAASSSPASSSTPRRAATIFPTGCWRRERIVVRNASIRWEDELRGAPPLELTQLNFVLQNDGSRHRFGLTAMPPRELAARLDVRGDFRGEDLDRLEAWKGEAYAELDYADLAGAGAPGWTILSNCRRERAACACGWTSPGRS